MITIFFTGFMGSGKTTIGKFIASEFNLKFFDVDEEIEKEEKKTVAEIFKQNGEQYFRNKEKEILHKISPRNMIVSLGGGTIKDPDNIRFIKTVGKTIYLEESAQTVMERLENVYKTRPLLEDHFNIQDITHMINVREPLYRDVANACIKVDNKTKDEIFMEILPYFNEWNKAEVFLKIF